MDLGKEIFEAGCAMNKAIADSLVPLSSERKKENEMRTEGKWKVAKANPEHHTPLYIYAEWFDDKKRRNSFIVADRFYEHPEHSHTANANFICKAVNHHDELVEALENFTEPACVFMVCKYLSKQGDDFAEGVGITLKAFQDHAKALLAKVKE
jgi:hypothetical protein